MAQHRRRQLEKVGEFAVPGGQRELRVEDADALACMVERMLQLIATRLDRGRRFVDELERRLAGHGPRPQEQRQHLARGRGADRRRKQEFRVADELRAGLLRGVLGKAAVVHEVDEGVARPSRAEIPGDRRLEFARCRRRTPGAERLRLAASARSGEGARLRALERVRLPGQRKGDEAATFAMQRRTAPPTSALGAKATSAAGLSHAIARGPCARKFESAWLQADRRQQQEIKPGERARVMPAIAPRAVPRRQKRPPRKAGAICATAANESRPIERGPLRRSPARKRSRGQERRRWRPGAPRERARRCRLRPPAPWRRAGRRMSGITRLLEMVMASATLSTTTIPVAADRPPTMVRARRPCAPALSGSARTVRSRLIEPSGKT